MSKKSEEGIIAKKDENFSEWFTQIVQRCKLADIRYNVKGFLVFQPWSVLAMEKMYKILEEILQKKRAQTLFLSDADSRRKSKKRKLTYWRIYTRGLLDNSWRKQKIRGKIGIASNK